MEVDVISREGKGKEKSGKGKKCGKRRKESHSGKGYAEKRQQNTQDSKVNVETVESMDTKQLIVGTSSRPNLKVKARARESRNPRWQKSVKVTAVNKSMKLGHQTRQHNSQIYLKWTRLDRQMRDEGLWIFSLENSKKRRYTVNCEEKSWNKTEEHELMIDSGCFGHVCPTWFAPQFPMVSSTNVEAVAANNVALQHCGQKVVYGHVKTNSGKRILIQITFDVMNVRKPLLSTSALKHRGVTIIFNHGYDRIIFRNETVNLESHDCHSYLHIILTNGVALCRALAMAGENATNDVDEEVYGNDGAERHEAQKLQLVIDEQSPIRIKPDSLIYLVKLKLQEYYVLLNLRQMLRERHTTRHTFHSEIGAQSVVRVADEVLRTDELWWTRRRILCRNSRRITCEFEHWQRAKIIHVSHSWKRAVE